jgi:hypothetical protein
MAISGTYTKTYALPTNSFAQPVQGTTIDPTDATSTLNDLKTALNTVVSQYPATLAFAQSVNFNSGNTDTSFTITLPSGFTRYRVAGVFISGASHDISTATAGLYTGAGATGTAIVTGGTTITVTATAEGTNANMQSMTVGNQNTQSWAVGTLYWRVATAEGATATAVVTIHINPMS